MDEFKRMIESYQFPKGSYLEVNGKMDEQYGEFGNLLGIRLILNQFGESQVQKIYKDLSKELSSIYIYKTIYQLQDASMIYYYGEDIHPIKDKIEKYIEGNNYMDCITMMEMSTIIRKKSE